MQPSTVPSSAGSLAMYLAEINRYPLLTVDETDQALQKSVNYRAPGR